MLSQLARGVGEVVFPPVCVQCGGLVDDGCGDIGMTDGGMVDGGSPDRATTDSGNTGKRYGITGCKPGPRRDGFRHVCGRCGRQIDFVLPPHCSTCGHPFYGEMEGERMCPHCEGLAPAYRQGRTAVLSKGAARALVHELKYHKGLFVLGDMEEIFRRSPPVM